MKQSEIFLKGEGDAWHKRNKMVARLPDMVLDAVNDSKLRPKSVLEIGCGSGWRLAALKSSIKCHVMGYDPSALAIAEGKEAGLNIEQATALEGLYFTKANYYDMVIFGFCLYLVDREDLQMIVGHADRVLRDGGYLVIHDFYVEWAYRNKYKHKEGVWSYKMDYSKLWLANPIYQEIHRCLKGAQDDCIGVIILQKQFLRGY